MPRREKREKRVTGLIRGVAGTRDRGPPSAHLCLDPRRLRTRHGESYKQLQACPRGDEGARYVVKAAVERSEYPDFVIVALCPNVVPPLRYECQVPGSVAYAREGPVTIRTA